MLCADFVGRSFVLTLISAKNISNENVIKASATESKFLRYTLSTLVCERWTFSMRGAVAGEDFHCKQYQEKMRKDGCVLLHVRGRS